jgi:hypothetical protein
MRGFAFGLCTRYEDSCLCFQGDYFRDLVARMGGSPVAHVAFTVARRAPGYVVSQILFRVWIYKLEISVGEWHTRRSPGGGIFLRFGKWTWEGDVYRGVGSLPYYLSYFWLFVI